MLSRRTIRGPAPGFFHTAVCTVLPCQVTSRGIPTLTDSRAPTRSPEVTAHSPSQFTGRSRDQFAGRSRSRKVTVDVPPHGGLLRGCSGAGGCFICAPVLRSWSCFGRAARALDGPGRHPGPGALDG